MDIRIGIIIQDEFYDSDGHNEMIYFVSFLYG